MYNSIIAAIIDTGPLPKTPANNEAVNTILAIVFGLAGSIALLIIVIAGFRYITAGGDPNSTAQARKAIIYAIVGLLVTLAAYSIVVFVVSRVA